MELEDRDSDQQRTGVVQSRRREDLSKQVLRKRCSLSQGKSGIADGRASCRSQDKAAPGWLLDEDMPATVIF